MLVREFHVAGAVDKLDSVAAAEKRWERQISRISNGLGFVRPKSESKDAVRKAEAKEKEIAKLAEFGDGELNDLKADLLARGDAKSVREAQKLIKEIDRRNATELDAAKAQRKALSDKLIARVPTPPRSTAARTLSRHCAASSAVRRRSCHAVIAVARIVPNSICGSSPAWTLRATRARGIAMSGRAWARR
jgi:hypothetical protein